jgi:hypothetical protein
MFQKILKTKLEKFSSICQQTNLSYISMARYLASTGTFNASHKLKIYSIVKKYILKYIRKVRSKKTYTFTGKNILMVFNFTEGKLS